jgi:tetratricopeptide (TPR) repeat protein
MRKVDKIFYRKIQLPFEMKELLMRTINIKDKSKSKEQKSKIQLKIKNFTFCIVILIFEFYILNLFFGCAQRGNLDRAKGYAQKSEVYYQEAIKEYKDLIAKGKESDRLYLELGKLYYAHGEFEQAIEALKKSNDARAKKLLAISFYHLGNFSDALEIFDKYKIPDEEYLFYQGLTCEKLNLFDKALEVYNKVKGEIFKTKSKERMDIIEKQAGGRHIKDIDAQINRIIANAAGQELYPQAGALILLCEEKIEVTAEKTQVSYLHYLIKILNERGKEDFSESHIDYDSTFEKVELEYARTIKPDGTVVEVGSRHIRDVSRYLNFPLYSNARVFIISFPEVVEGCCIEYKLKIKRSQLLNKKDFVLSYPVQSGEPIITADFTVILPKDKPLQIKIINEEFNDFAANLKPNTEESNDRMVYYWQFKDIPAIIPESNMPPNVQINPTILISTFNSWQDVYNWWWQLARDKIKADDAIKNKVKELTGGLNSEEEKIRAIYNFSAQKIRYVAVEYGQAGYEPHNAADIFKNKYGDCKDQAILLVSMLKEAGFIAWPVLIATKEHYNLNVDFPSLFFNHCIAAVCLKDKLIFLDPTAQTCSFGDLPANDQGRKVLVFKEDKYEIHQTPLYPANHNFIKQQLKIKVDKDESIQAEKINFTYGSYDQLQRYWLLFTQPELIQEALKERIQDISIGAELISSQISNLEDLNRAVVLSYIFQGPEYSTVAGNLRILPQLASLDTSLVAKDKRKYAIDFSILDTKEMYLEIEIPKNFVIKYMPASITEDSPWLKFIVEYSHKESKVLFKQIVELKKNLILENEYSNFKNFYEGLAKRIKQRIVLQKIR